MGRFEGGNGTGDGEAPALVVEGDNVDEAESDDDGGCCCCRRPRRKGSFHAVATKA